MTQRSFLSALLLGFVLFAGCRGERGPSGPPGPPGPAGSAENALGRDVFEVTADFNAGNDFFEAFVLEPNIAQDDIVLIYLLWEAADGLDIWRPLPVSIFHSEGLFVYNYDFTTVDFGLFLEGEFDLNALGPEWTETQVFRVVVLEQAGLTGMPDDLDYRTVAAYIGIEEEAVKRINPERAERKVRTEQNSGPK